MIVASRRRNDVPLTEKLALTLEEATALSAIGRTRLYAAIERGELRAKKDGRRTMILRADLVAYLNNRPDFEPGRNRYGKAAVSAAR